VILDADGKPLTADTGEPCNHGITFDEDAALELIRNWSPADAAEFIVGPPGSREIRKRWPRLFGVCPLGCGYQGIYYASWAHYTMGDW
jgi:hypothetical protein